MMVEQAAIFREMALGISTNFQQLEARSRFDVRAKVQQLE
jgi:hypothetical protein